LEQFKTIPRKESPETLLALLDRLTDIASLGLVGLESIELHGLRRREIRLREQRRRSGVLVLDPTIIGPLIEALVSGESAC
jgi:hypothetical protein